MDRRSQKNENKIHILTIHTNMIIAESKGKISHSYMQFIMGHKGDIEARYSTNKGAIAHYDRGYAKSLQRMQAISKHGTHL